MKKNFIAIVFCLVSALFFSPAKAQTVQGTLKEGSAANAVMVVLKPSATFSGQITEVIFTIQIPNTVSPQPTVTIKSNPLSTYIPTSDYVARVSNEGGFYNYVFDAVVLTSPDYNFNGGTEIAALELEINGVTVNPSNVRLANVPNGGSILAYFYIEVNGVDRTNEAAMFYGLGAVNAGTYSGYSYVPLQTAGGVLPVLLQSFSAAAGNCLVNVKWQATGETGFSYYAVERSSDGNRFSEVVKVQPEANRHAYSYTDDLAANGTYIYRLRLVDKDGRFTFSSLARVELTCNSKRLIRIYPTLSTGEITVSLPAGMEKANVQVLNMLGQEVLSNKMGNANRQLSLHPLKNGVYYVQVIYNNAVMATEKIVLTH